MDEIQIQNKEALASKEGELLKVKEEVTKLQQKIEETEELPTFSNRSGRRKSADKNRPEDEKNKRNSSGGRNPSL